MNAFEFLQNTSPFNQLPDAVIENVAAKLEKKVFSKDQVLYEQEISKLRGVDLLVSGSYDTFFYDSARNRRRERKLQSGQIYGGISILLNQKLSVNTVWVEKGTEIYFLHRKYFRELCAQYEGFQHFFTSDFAGRMMDNEFAHFFKKPAWRDDSFLEADQFFSKRMGDIPYRKIIYANENLPVFEVVKAMAEQKVSCIYITDEGGKIVGYLTDILLRDQIVGTRKSPETLAKEIMDPKPIVISVNNFVFEAVLKMYRNNTKYLLIEKDGNYIGFQSRNRLLAEQSQSPILFIQTVKLANSDEELREKWLEAPKIITQLLERGVHARVANQVITTISDSIAEKVIERTIHEIGPAPARFCFMVLGSEGRKEQTFKTDQDNAIIYEDKANEHREEVRAYFLEFSKKVSESLDKIGFSFCTGGYMAMNPKWTHSLSHWKRNYEEWVADAIPETVVKFTTFFDCRFLFGDENIMQELYGFLDELLQKPMERVFYFMTKNALQYEPPLTFFKGIKTFTKGDNEVFDVKRAMTPIVDLVRVYALKHRVKAVNTGERIRLLQQKGIFTEQESEELRQSYYLLMSMRLKHQARAIIEDSVDPDNYILLNRFSRIERLTLVEIFKTIKSFQTKIKLEFTKEL
ncbi:MAG: signal transduction protein [Pseudopedobacter saltans]|uniref:Signal transduction protein n=1 Tax=Pseudopedobacter saltans TaxID=151895 RepID=A0A2W5F4W2_9SPHI|nr:MAG: signal transduction protein [Pseudopedobacter saltans]